MVGQTFERELLLPVCRSAVQQLMGALGEPNYHRPHLQSFQRPPVFNTPALGMSEWGMCINGSKPKHKLKGKDNVSMYILAA